MVDVGPHFVNTRPPTCPPGCPPKSPPPLPSDRGGFKDIGGIIFKNPHLHFRSAAGAMRRDNPGASPQRSEKFHPISPKRSPRHEVGVGKEVDNRVDGESKSGDRWMLLCLVDAGASVFPKQRAALNPVHGIDADDAHRHERAQNSLCGLLTGAIPVVEALPQLTDAQCTGAL